MGSWGGGGTGAEHRILQIAEGEKAREELGLLNFVGALNKRTSTATRTNRVPPIKMDSYGEDSASDGEALCAGDAGDSSSESEEEGELGTGGLSLSPVTA